MASFSWVFPLLKQCNNGGLMTRDYKNINRKKNGKTVTTQLQPVMPFITGLVIGLFVAFIVYLKEHQTEILIDQSPELVIQNIKKPVIPDADSIEETGITEPQFEFYQILPNMEVNVSEWEAEENKKSEPIAADDSGVYILQVGSFEQYEAADEVKARLALLGVSADIQRVVINGRDIRHRVRVGPYKDPAKLQEARDRLLTNNLDFILLKLKLDDL
jgi:cell division protein FtsN